MTGHKRFVVLSMARSGTSLLLASLRQHPEILCHGEIFHRKPEAHIREEYRSVADLSGRETDPIGFAADLLEFTGGRACVGFKMWRLQSETACDYLLGRTDVAKIILERKNKLAHFSSGQLAKQSGIWNIGVNQPRARRKRIPQLEAVRADFDRRQFLQFVDEQSRLFEHYRRSAKGPCLDITYHEMAGGDFSEVLSFLGVTVLPLVQMKKRIHGSDILSRYHPEQHDDIVRTLGEIGHGDWVAEDVKESSAPKAAPAAVAAPTASARAGDTDWAAFEGLFEAGAYVPAAKPAARLIDSGANDPRLRFAVAAKLHRGGQWDECLRRLDGCILTGRPLKRMLVMKADAEIAVGDLAAAERTVASLRGTVRGDNKGLAEIEQRLAAAKDAAAPLAFQVGNS